MSKRLLLKTREQVQEDGAFAWVTGLDRVRDEIDILCQLEHPNVIKLFEVIDDPNNDSMYLGWTGITDLAVLCFPAF